MRASSSPRQKYSEDAAVTRRNSDCGCQGVPESDIRRCLLAHLILRTASAACRTIAGVNHHHHAGSVRGPLFGGPTKGRRSRGVAAVATMRMYSPGLTSMGSSCGGANGHGIQAAGVRDAVHVDRGMR